MRRRLKDLVNAVANLNRTPIVDDHFPELREKMDLELARAERLSQEMPRIICLCGSTRFPEAWKEQTRRLSLGGCIVLSVGVMIHAGDEPIRTDGPEKEKLDKLHLWKINLADEVFVLNVGGYIGASTAREIQHAIVNEKPISYLEPETTRG